VITWPAVLILAYLLILVTGLVLSFTTRQQPRRRNIRIGTGVVSIPIWLILAFGVFMWFTFGKEPPTLGELQREFASKRGDLETILRMSDEDAKFSRIAPDFLDRTPDGPNDFERYMKNDPKAGLPESRWGAYRRIYSRNGIKLGIQRNASRDAFIMVDSVGLLNRGHASGYVYCASTAPPNANRYYPCMLNKEKDERRYDPDTREEGYSFQKLDGRWYAYDEGPS
jgi:hypothetical protein